MFMIQKQKTLLYCSIQKYIIIKMQGSMHSAFGIFLSALLILIDYQTYSQSISGSPTVTVINANSAYNFAIVDPNLQNNDGTITIGFPSTLYTLTTVSCYNSQSNSQTYPCSVSSGNKVVITYTRGSFPSSFLPIGITTIKNPPSKQSLNFTYTFSSGSTTFSQSYVITDPLTPDTLTACTVSFSPSTVFTQATIIFNFTTKNQLDANGGTYITFPSNWNNSASIAYTPFTTTSPTITCAAISPSPLKSVFTCDSFSSTIEANSIFSTTVNANTVVVFSASKIKTPPTTSISNTITITTQTSAGYLVDQSICTVTAVSQQILPLTSTSTFVVGSLNSLTLTWITASPIKVGDIFTINLPTTYMLFSQLTGIATLYENTKLIGRSNVTSNSTQYRFTISSLSDTQISVGHKIQLSNFIAQCLVDTSPRIATILISRGGNNIATGSLTITPTPNALINVTVKADVGTVESAMTLNITFSNFNSLLQNSQLRLQIPSTITTIGTSPTCQISSTTSPSAILSSISCTISSNVISIPSFLQSTLSASSVITILISNVFRNPITTEPTSQFIISTISSANYSIDQSSNITYSATSATIGSLTIVPTSFQVRAQTEYLLTYNILRTIKSGSTIQVTIPPQVSISGSASYSYLIGNGTSYTTISPSLSGSTLTFSGIINTQMTTGSTIKIKLSGLINPSSLKPSSSFQVVVGYLTYPIQTLTSGLTVTMTTLADFRSVSAIVTDPKNGATKDYSFFFQPSIAMATGDQIILKIIDTTNSTNQIKFSGTTVTCAITYSTVTLTNTCSVSGSTLTITLSGALSDATGAIQYLLVVSSFVLARTPRASSSFSLTTFTGGYGVQTSTLSSILNTKANNIQSLVLQVLTLPSQLNQYEQLKLTFKTFNGIDMMNGQYFIIDIPTVFTYKGTNTTVICTTSIFNCTLNNNFQIKVVKSSSYSTNGYVTDFSLTLNDTLYVSPLDFNFNSQYFYVTTYTSNSLIIDTTDPITITASKAVFYRTCGGFCGTCPSSNLTFCSTCYNASYTGVLSSTYGGYSIKTSDNQCVDVCGTGFYIINGTCTKCLSPCNACLNETTCTSCLNGTYYYYNSTLNSTTRCWSLCPEGFYGDSISNQCISCAFNCKTCANISTLCTSCTGLYYLSGSTCVTQCPDGTYENSLTYKCEACDAGCLLTCIASATDCVACKTGYYRLSATSNACVNTCPSGSVKNQFLSICGCTSPCGTCSGLLTNCSTCVNSSYILYNNNCISSCPSQTYNSSNVCVNCIDTSCSRCNETNCLICLSNYYLYDGRCYLSCPVGTRIDNLICSLCPQGCRTCITNTDCTSCFSGFLVQGSSCVTSCQNGTINFNATTCVSSCPVGYFNNGGVCQIQTSNGTNSTNNTVIQNNTVNQSLGRIIPFPYTITYVVAMGVSIGMRCLYPITLLPSVMMSFGCILEIMSALTLIIVAFIEFNALIAGIGIVIISAALIYICNVISLLFIIKVLNNDEKFMRNYKRKVCPNIVIRIISVLTYHKFHQIVFSNIFGVKVFCNKVDYVRRLYPFNVLLIISLFISLLLVIGASLTGYQVQTSLLSSPSFIQSVDCIIIVVLNVIPTILVLRRKDASYEVQIDDKQAKRYQTQDQLNMHNDSQGIQQVFIEEGGGDANGKAGKISQRRKNYYYQNSKRSQGGQDPYQTPLDKKRSTMGNPINSSPNALDGQHSSEALLFGKKKNKNQIQQISDGIQQIVLEEPEGDNLSPGGRKIKNSKMQASGNSMINYVGYDLDPRLLELPQNSQQFKKLPSETKAKIRLAKANIQINKNSSVFKKQTINEDLQQIQLSPKKNKQNLLQQNAHSQYDENYGSRKNLMDDEVRNERLKGSKSNQKDKSKQKNKSKSKEKNKSPKRSKSKSPQRKNQLGTDEKQEDKQQAEESRMVRNRSEQMKKKQHAGLKTTKSQNITKTKKKANNQIKVLFNGNQIQNLDNNQDNINENDIQFEEQDEPRLPVFKKSKGKGREGHLDYESDGLENNDGSKKDRYKRALPSQRQSQQLQDQNVKNLRDIKGQRTIPNQQPDDLPHLHSSQQLGNLVIINRKFKNRKPGDLQFSNDDSSIYHKIYNDETQTLKSVQGDNFFGQQVSPSQFNVQNQRFQQTQASNEMPVPATFDLQVQDYQDNQDGFDSDENGKKRYSSNNNIDYDSVLSKRLNNDKIKKLEQIYLPRLDVIKPKRKKK